LKQNTVFFRRIATISHFPHLDGAVAILWKGETQVTKNKKIILGCVAAVLLLAALVGVWFAFGPQSAKEGTTTTAVTNEAGESTPSTEKGGKSVTIEVVNKAGVTTTYNVRTDAKHLRGVMEEADGLTFVEENGMVMSVNGERADYTLDKAYWAFYIGEAYCNYGINDQPVADGDVFRIVYTAA
jgi:hypothetical protein